MKPLLLSMLIPLAVSAWGEQVVLEQNWPDLARSGQLLGGKIIQEDARSVLKLENTNNAPVQISILEIRNPPIESNRYALLGEVRYESVDGQGYLETWNHFSKETAGGAPARYFSRTLSPSGPMGNLSGSSGWREFSLPFYVSRGDARPERIELNLHLPGKGAVFLSTLRLVQYPNDVPVLHLGTSAWWTESTGGMVGGIGGAVLGCLAGLFAFLAGQGKGRGFVLAGIWVMIMIGAVSTAVACVALLLHQPYAVWFPLMLVGLLLLLVMPFRLKDFHGRYNNQELRRIAALDS